MKMESRAINDESNFLYTLQKSIYKNTYTNYWDELIASKGLTKVLNENGKEYRFDLLIDKFKKGVISIEDINSVLEKELMYGRQRNLEIYEFKFNKSFNHRDNIQENFNLPMSDKYNKLLEVSNGVGIGSFKLGYFNIVSANDEFILKANLIYVTKIEVNSKGEKEIENSYFPLEIDFENEKIIIKYYEKSGVGKGYRGEEFTSKIMNQLFAFSGIDKKFIDQTKNQKALYNICDELLNELINEISKKSISNIESMVREVSDLLRKKIGCNVDLLYQEYHDNIFDIEGQIKIILENIAVKKVFCELKGDSCPQHMKGKISYIRYREKNSRTTLKKDKKIANLIDSKTYLSIRKIIEEINVIEEIKVVFNKGIKVSEKHKVSLKYDASKFSHLGIKFYERYDEGDVAYAIEQFRGYREKN